MTYRECSGKFSLDVRSLILFLKTSFSIACCNKREDFLNTQNLPKGLIPKPSLAIELMASMDESTEFIWFAYRHNIRIVNVGDVSFIPDYQFL